MGGRPQPPPAQPLTLPLLLLVSLSGASAAAAAHQPRVLNFFPVPIDEECPANDGRRSGVCMNTYECRLQGGQSFGSCAMGLGVCCVCS